MSSTRRATLCSALQHPSPQPQEPSKLRQGTKRAAVQEAENARTTTSLKQISQRFKSAKHEPAAAQPPVALKQSQTQTQTQPQTKINGASTACVGAKGGVSSGSSGSSSSSSAASQPNVPRPTGFDAALWSQLTAHPSPVAIPANSIKLTYLHGLLSPAECASFLSLGRASGYCRSETTSGISLGRTSFSSDIEPSNPLVRGVHQRVVDLCGPVGARIIQMAVVRYEPGQLFNAHYDSSNERTKQRQYTIFAYLNDVEGGGGETEFTKLGVKFKPRRGDALLWENRKTESTYHLDGLHAGRPPISGVKYGLNCWIEFGASDPQRNAHAGSVHEGDAENDGSSSDDGSDSDESSSERERSRSSHGSEEE